MKSLGSSKSNVSQREFKLIRMQKRYAREKEGEEEEEEGDEGEQEGDEGEQEGRKDRKGR